MHSSLDSRAAAFARTIADVAMDESGVVRGVIHFDEQRPLRPGDVPADALALGQGDPIGFQEYEDAAMATGEFLAAQSLRFRVTGDAAAKELADRAFAGLRWIYELGRTRAEGFFPKPYGRRISDQISRDQYLFAMAGMAEYHAVAATAARREIERMMAAMAGYWIGIRYTHSYFGLPAGSHLDDFMGSLFLGIIGMAHRFSGEMQLGAEYERLLAEERLGDRMQETLRSMFRAGETYDGGTYFRQHENPVMMKTIALDYLWDADSDRRGLWEAALKRFWQDDMLVMLDRTDGMNYWFVGFDPAQDRTYLTDPRPMPDLENPLNLSQLTWGGRRKSAGSAKTAYSAVVAADRLGLDDAAATARDILEKMDFAKFRGLTAPGPEHIPPGLEWETDILHTGYLSCWQWAYWLGRMRGLW